MARFPNVRTVFDEKGDAFVHNDGKQTPCFLLPGNTTLTVVISRNVCSEVVVSNRRRSILVTEQLRVSIAEAPQTNTIPSLDLNEVRSLTGHILAETPLCKPLFVPVASPVAML